MPALVQTFFITLHTIILSNLLALPIDFGSYITMKLEKKLLLGQTVVFFYF